MGGEQEKNAIKLPEALKSVAKSLNFNKIEIPKILINTDDRYFLAAENLGKKGWTIPFSFTPRQIAFFEDLSLSNEIIDNFFLEYYLEEDNFNRLLTMIYDVQLLAQWHPAIKQCEIAHRNELYILSISTLIPILEGVLSKFEDDKNNIRMIRVCKEKLEESVAMNSGVQTIMWTSCLHFVTTLYSKSDFSEPKPQLINRHWILHGRTEIVNSEVESIRLFNTLETIANIIYFQTQDR
ncbi:hypothetical protein DET54_1254 [Paenibacillus pabuli]|uniref:Uncharacterized protein n=1 Tax=Paenibacillus pabuli TaxID=1472 RepID=A0ABX9BBE6_9BACL|nr:hypothetical protein [Paenibacillus pabuli]RAI84426.1 hypothetical protein DET54_1254 [Paenibacillus pabuli]